MRAKAFIWKKQWEGEWAGVRWCLQQGLWE